MNRPPPLIPDYEVLRRIGRGSYGEVWLARSVTGLYRAAKVIYRDQFDEQRPYEREFTGIQRFEPISRSNESQIDVLHVGRNDERGYFYYLMELADDANEDDQTDGLLDPSSYAPKTLKAVLAARRRLTVAETLPLGIALADALTHLHANGLVHRDIKPSNIIFVNGRAKLADIGLVAATDASHSFVGTEGFVPREGPGTPRADIFGLGKVLYECCTGRDRLEFPSLPEDLELLPDRAEVGELNEVLLKACDPDASLRYGSGSDLKNDLELIRAHRSVRRLRRLELTVRRGRRLTLAGLAAALVVGFGWYQSHRFNRMASSQLAHVYVKNGQERLEQNDWLGSLPWFAKSLELESGLAERELAHCLRIANTLEWCPQLIALYTHSRPARYAFFNPSASQVLLCDEGTTAQLWDPITDRPLSPKLQHGGQPFLGIFSPDGTRVATASRGDGAGRLWDVRSGGLIGRPFVHGRQVNAMVFGSDNRWLATGGEDGVAHLWRASDGTDTGLSFNQHLPVSLVALSQDGHRLMTAGGDHGTSIISVWDTTTGAIIGTPVEQPGSIRSAQFSPEGDCVTSGTTAGEVWLWKPENPGRRWTASLGHPMVRVVFSPDGSRVLAASEWSARLLDSHSGQAIGPLIQAYGTLRSAEFSPDGSRFILAGESRTAMIYDSRTERPLIPLIKHGGEIYRAFFVKNDEWITASADNTVRRWRSPKGEIETARFSHPQPIKDLTVSPDHRWIITADAQGMVRKFPLKSGATLAEMTHQLLSEPAAMALSGNGRALLMAMRDGNLACFSTDDLVAMSGRPGPGSGVVQIIGNPAKNEAALRDCDGSVWLWDVEHGELKKIPIEESGTASDLAFSPDGTRLAVVKERNVVLVTLSQPARPVTIHHNDRIWHIGFDPEGKRLMVSSEDRVLRWWSAEDGTPLSLPLRGDGGINFGVFSADQRRVFTASANYDAMIWNAMSGQPMTPPFKPRPGLNGASFSANDNWLALTSSEGTLQVWDGATGEAMTPPLMTHGKVNLCRFSPDGQWIITVEDSRTVVCRPFLREACPCEQALRQATLLAGYQVDNHGFLIPVDREEIVRLTRLEWRKDPTP